MTQTIFQTIESDIKNNDIVFYMKGTRDMPKCGFSSNVSGVLKKLNLTFKDINVLDNQDIRQGIKDYSNWPTIPQLYIKGEFIGGYDIVKEMHKKGDLKELLIENGLISGA